MPKRSLTDFVAAKVARDVATGDAPQRTATALANLEHAKIPGYANAFEAWSAPL